VEQIEQDDYRDRNPNSQSKMPLPIVTTFLTGLWSVKNYWHDAELIEKIDVTASKSLDKKNSGDEFAFQDFWAISTDFRLDCRGPMELVSRVSTDAGR
jgi:hypothetical protein